MHKHNIGVLIDIDQPFGNGRRGIYRLGEGISTSPKIVLGPHLKEVAHRDNTKRSS